MERTPGGTGGAQVAGRDQVGDRLGLRQVQPVVEEGPLAELARPRHPRAEVATARHQLLQHDGAAVRLQLHHVLAGEAGGCGEVQREAIVDGAAIGIHEGDVVGVPRRKGARGDRFADGHAARAGQAHDADTARARRRRDRDDRVGGVRAGGGVHGPRGQPLFAGAWSP